MRLAQVIGQAQAVRVLRRLISRERVPSALVFTGIPGCGRRTLALAVAQAMVCSSPQAGDACGTCQHCQLAGAGNHPDITALPNDHEPGPDDQDWSRQIPVERIRDLAEAAFSTPLLANRRVFILPAAERLAASEARAANTLLKVLEEPPAGVHLILTAVSISGLIPTVRSRVQPFRLMALSAVDIEQILVNRGMPSGRAIVAAANAQGSLRHLDQSAGEAAPVGPLIELARNGYSGALIADVLALMPAAKRAQSEASPAAIQRHTLGQWLSACIPTLRERLRAGDASAIGLIERFHAAERDLRLNLPARTVLELLASSSAR